MSSFESLSPLAVQDPTDELSVVYQHRRRFLTRIDQPLVLISQIQRSGGTLLVQLLDGHSQLHVHPWELHIGGPAKTSLDKMRPKKTQAKAKPSDIGRPKKAHLHIGGLKKTQWPRLDLSADPQALFEALEEKIVLRHAQSGYRKINAPGRMATPEDDVQVLPFVFLHRLQAELFTACVSRSSQREVLSAYATSYFNAWLDYQGLYKSDARAWVGFIPGFLTRPGSIDAYVVDYPDGRVLVSVRDPVSWFASARRHHGAFESVDYAVRHWKAGYEAVLAALEQRGEMILLVRYEDVVSDTEPVMRRVARFLGLDFEPSLLRPTFNGMDITSNSSFGAVRGLDPSGVDRSDQVASADRDLIRDQTGPLVARLQQAIDEQAGRQGQAPD